MMLAGGEGPGIAEERRKLGEDMRQRIKEYASDQTGLQPGSEVWSWDGSKSAMEDHIAEEAGIFSSMVAGKSPRPNQRVIYVDGGFDLFSSGHIEFLRQVIKAEDEAGRERGWYDEGRRSREEKHMGRTIPGLRRRWCS
jgi:ethanolamine-phosphate cytidylyltransferase